MLQALLDVDLVSAVVCVSTGPGLVGPKPLGVEDTALYPLGSRGSQCLSTAISGLLFQVEWIDVCLTAFVCVCVFVLVQSILLETQEICSWMWA